MGFFLGNIPQLEAHGLMDGWAKLRGNAVDNLWRVSLMCTGLRRIGPRGTVDTQQLCVEHHELIYCEMML